MLYENDRQTARKENSIVLAAHDNLSTAHLLHTELHWLDVPERVLYKLALMVHRVSRTRRRSICRTTVSQSLKLPIVSNCDLPLVISFY